MPSAKSKLILEATSPRDGTNLNEKNLPKKLLENMDIWKKHSKTLRKREEGLRNIETR